MTSTPTGVPPGPKRGKGYYLRRRIELQKDEEDTDKTDKEEASTSGQLETRVEKSSPSEEMPSLESSDNSSDTVIFDKESYNLSSSSKKGHKSYNGTFFKSVTTPSRSLGRKRLKEGKSFLYRTPCIKSGMKDYTIRSGKSIPRAYKITWQGQLENILQKYWKICYLSSMFGFHYSKRNLRSCYLRALKIKILDVYPSYKLTVTITPSSLIHQNIKRTDSLFIVVDSLSFPDEDEIEKLSTVYEAILIRSKHHQSLPLNATDWFPLMLYKGNESIHNSVVRWLQASFGCYITPKGITMSSLLLLTASWSHATCTNSRHERNADRMVTFRYEARPPNLRGIPMSGNSLSLRLSIKVDTILQLWRRILGNDEREFNFERVSRFYCALEGLIESLTHIPKDLLSLVEVQTACNSISKTGKIRMTCDKSFASLFQHLIEVFEDVCHFNVLKEEGESVGEETIQEDNL